VLNGGTEPAFSSPLNDIKQSGDFVCARKGCDAVLFRTDTKYDSGTGWPSFWDPVDDNVKLEKGNFLSFMFGTECKCRKCDGHLGHRFDDGCAPSVPDARGDGVLWNGSVTASPRAGLKAAGASSKSPKRALKLASGSGSARSARSTPATGTSGSGP